MISTAYTRIEAFILFINRGGPINWFIFLLYLAALVIICERASYFLRSSYRRSDLLDSLSQRAAALASGKDPLGPTIPARSQAGKLANVFIEHKDRSAVVLVEVINREGSTLRAEMDSHLAILSLIGAVAPVAGLLGTVTGLMTAFGRIETLGGAVDIASLSGGIWEAMITTACGLGVAIPTVAADRIFERIADARSRDMDYTVSVLTEVLREDCLACGTESDTCSAAESA